MSTLIALEAAGPEAGGKAATLGMLSRSGERVPRGVVIAAGIELDAVRQDLIGWISEHPGPLAVRSSAADEDGWDVAEAGTYLTELDVDPSVDSVLEAARRVSASGTDVAVLIQPMLEPRVSGVAFSADPTTGDPDTIVEAVAGVAEELTSGSVSGVRYRRRDDSWEGGSSILSDAELDEVDAALGRISQALGGPVDVEWAWCDDGLWILQARPITALPRPPAVEIPPGTWEKDVTHSPRPVSPMMASLSSVTDGVLADWSERWGLMIGGLRTLTVGGELYTQPIPLVGGVDAGPTPPWWLLAVVARIAPPIRRRLRAAARAEETGRADECVRKWTNEWKRSLRAEITRVRSLSLDRLSDDELHEVADDAIELLRRGTEIHFDLFVPYLLGVHPYVETAERILGWDTARALAALAGRSPASTVSDGLVRDIVAAVRRVPGAEERVRSSGHPVEEVRSVSPEAALAVEAWLAEVGFRSSDYDVAAPLLADLPGLLDHLLLAGLDAVDGQITHGGLRNLEHLDEADRDELETAFDRAAAVFWLREDNVHLTGTMPGAALHRVIAEIGRRLADRGVIQDPHDVFYLKRDELVDASGDMRDTVRRRRAEQAWVAAHPGPMRLGPEPSSPPDVRGLPGPARRVNAALMWAMSHELSSSGRSTTDGIRGVAGGGGSHVGTVRIVRTEAELVTLNPGDVMVCPIATTAWSVVFGTIGAIVCDGGGALSHTAIVAREHGVPSVMAVGDATARLRDGDTVRVDGTAGTVELL